MACAGLPLSEAKELHCWVYDLCQEVVLTVQLADGLADHHVAGSAVGKILDSTLMPQ